MQKFNKQLEISSNTYKNDYFIYPIIISTILRTHQNTKTITIFFLIVELEQHTRFVPFLYIMKLHTKDVENYVNLTEIGCSQQTYARTRSYIEPFVVTTPLC